MVEVGNRYGRLVVIEMMRPGVKARCRCDCGKETVVFRCNLSRGNTTSCGCFHRERTVAAKTTHGKSNSREYNSWGQMIVRCTNPKVKIWPYYGGRGITICEEWLASFASFHRDMGDRPPGTSLDRIDNNGNYEPGNCKWSTRSEQMRNRRPYFRSTTWKRLLILLASCQLGDGTYPPPAELL